MVLLSLLFNISFHYNLPLEPNITKKVKIVRCLMAMSARNSIYEKLLRDLKSTICFFT